MMKIIAIVFTLAIATFCPKFSFGQKGYCFADSCRFQKIPDTIDVYNGNTFSISWGCKTDYIDNDPRRDEPPYGIRRFISVEQYVPLKVNGKKIFYDFAKEPTTKHGQPFRLAVLKTLEPEVTQLGNGEYKIDLGGIVFDENGRSIYFDTVYTSFNYREAYNRPRLANYRIMKTLLLSTLQNIEMAPVYNNKKKIPFGILKPFLTVYIVVENGKVTYYNLP